MAQKQAVVIFVTTSSSAEAGKIGRVLVEEKLAACANIVPLVRSIYRWQGKICDESEALMVLKTRSGQIQKIIKRVRSLHSYTVPEIIVLPISAGSKDYLRWIFEVTR
ncbi:MAG TPA: divalent-cation tolerance protein CutA [Nitrospiria bacterium]|nr:divalent-cation tolerance protein CutA [Nitrospiria bacterium]